GRVHHLSRALAGHREVHDLSAAGIPTPVCQRRLSAEHAADRRPPRAGAVPDRSADDRRAVTAFFSRLSWIGRANMLSWRPTHWHQPQCLFTPTPARTMGTGDILTRGLSRGRPWTAAIG